MTFNAQPNRTTHIIFNVQWQWSLVSHCIPLDGLSSLELIDMPAPWYLNRNTTILIEGNPFENYCENVGLFRPGDDERRTNLLCIDIPLTTYDCISYAYFPIISMRWVKLNLFILVVWLFVHNMGFITQRSLALYHMSYSMYNGGLPCFIMHPSEYSFTHLNWSICVYFTVDECISSSVLNG